MNSLDVWAAAARDREAGLRWRDRVTARMTRGGAYRPYEELVASEARELPLPPDAASRLHEA